MVDQAVLILQGRNEELLRRQQAKMKEASDALQFEEAARIRDRIEAIRLTMERQRVVDVREGNRDVIGVCQEGPRTEVALLRIRGGNLQERKGYSLPDVVVSTGELLRSFLLQVYSETGLCPPAEILLFEEPEDRETLEEVLAERRDGPCSLKVPQRGEKKKLVELAVLNARSLLDEHFGEERTRRVALAQIQKKTGMKGPPDRIECFDISDLHGTFAVGACVVFLQGEPCKQEYRRYKVRVTRGSDDYAMMYEVLSRRLERGRTSGTLPDLLLVDGGKGHLNVAVEALAEAGVHGVRVAAIAKAREFRHRGQETAPGEGSQEDAPPDGTEGDGPTDRIFVPGRANPLNFTRSVGGMRLLQQVRDEAHRFALAYHRRLRSKDLERSELDGIPGVGRKRKQLLLAALGDVESIRQASAEDLTGIPGIDEKTAQQIRSHFHPDEPSSRSPARDKDVPE
jgi:excinuclease ABC subunit C